MKKQTITGIFLLLLGILMYLSLEDEISGISQAIIIGLVIGSALVLKSQVE